jgi:predicted TIM-barrel fold metal-dependent hydrolase
LSLTAPGPGIVSGPASTRLARVANEKAAAIRDAHPQQYGFFAAVPSLLDTEAALSEIQYALDVLKADGVTLFTRYGDGNYYLGHENFKAIWDELDKRVTVVFIHPTHPVDTSTVNKFLAQPIIDYPHETTRTAVDLIISDTVRTHQNVKIILSHAGGTLP